MSEVRVMVTGSRGWQNSSLIRNVLVDVDFSARRGSLGPLALVSGACPTGADAIAEHIAERLGWRIERHPADWQGLGRGAGYLRNADMAKSSPSLCVAFWDGESRGTSHAIRQAQECGVPTYVYREEGPWQMPSGSYLTNLVG